MNSEPTLLIPAPVCKYTVSYLVDVEVDGNHRDAAQSAADRYFQARIAAGEPHSACCFEVTGSDKVAVTIDLSEAAPAGLTPQSHNEFTVTFNVDVEIAGDHRDAAQEVADRYFQPRIAAGEQDSACWFIVAGPDRFPVEIDLADSLSDLEGDDTL